MLLQVVTVSNINDAIVLNDGISVEVVPFQAVRVVIFNKIISGISIWYPL